MLEDLIYLLGSQSNCQVQTIDGSSPLYDGPSSLQEYCGICPCDEDYLGNRSGDTVAFLHFVFDVQANKCSLSMYSKLDTTLIL